MNVALLERDLDTQRQTAMDRYKAIGEVCEKESRERTDDERKEVTALIDKAKATEATLARAKGDSDMLATIEGLGKLGPKTGGGNIVAGVFGQRRRPLTLGQQYVASAAMDYIRKGGHRSASRWTTPAVELFDPAGGWMPTDLQAATLTEDPASGGALVAPTYQPGILPTLFKRLTVADLFASGTADSPVIIYMREKTFTNAAAPVLEGGAKPESALTFEQAQDALRKIAHWLPVSEEMLEDVAQIRSYIDARLRLGVELKEEDQLLYGTGVAPEVNGLMTRAGLAPDVVKAASPDTIPDAIFRQIMAVFNLSFLQPDGIIMNPADWAKTVLTKTSAGEYLTAGPFAPIQTPTLWGLPVVVTPSVTAGTAIVGAFKTGAQVWRRGGITVEASNSHSDFFVKNLVAIRAEERVALAVYRPQAFGEVTGLATALREGEEGGRGEGGRRES